MKNTKTKLISSVAVLLICFAMLIGSTFAWFTDNASTGVNTIQAGNLDIEAYYQNTTLSAVEGQTTTYSLPEGSPRGNSIIFENTTNPLDGAELIDDNVKFEPGYVGAKLVTVKNVGNLAAKIKLQFAVKDNGLADQIWYDFMQVTKNANNQNEVTGNYDPNRLLTGIANFASGYEKSLSAGNEYKFIFMYGMKETAGNEYQGKSVDLSVTVLAKQMTEEYDSFDNQYDDEATYDSTIWDGTSITVVQPAGDVYEINTAAELAWVAEAVNEGTKTFANETVKLMKDINLANMPWTPIGTDADSDNKFKGTFDGKGYTISNLYVKQDAGYHAAGLFGALNGTVKDLTIDGAYIENLSTSNSDGATDNGTAIVAGSIYQSGTISKVTVKNAVVKGNRYVGGIAGYVYGNVTNCSVQYSSIVATPDMLTGEYDNGDKVGGIVGYLGEGGMLVDTCSVTDTKITGYRDIGGISGYLQSGSSVTNSNIANVTINVDKSHNYKHYSSDDEFDAKNIVGEFYGTITNCTGEATINFAE